MRTLPGYIFCFLLLLFLIAGCGGGSGSSSEEQPFSIDKKVALDAAITQWQAKFQAPGVVAGVWIPGQGSYVAARGLANEATGKPMEISDHFRIGSVTKTFVATVLLQLADEKAINLDDPVSNYLSYVPNGQNIKLRELVNMTSGLFDYLQDPNFDQETLSDRSRVWSPMELINTGLSHPPVFTPPGSQFDYSNTNFVLLGVIIEQVTGQPLAQVLQQRIFTPLGLKNTSWPTTSAMPVPYASGVTTQTLSGEKGDATHFDPSFTFAAGNLISNLDDLRVWMKSVATGTLLSPAMQQQRLQFVTVSEVEKVGYGLGIANTNGWLGHAGILPGYNTTAFYLPKLDATIVVEVNSNIFVNDQHPADALFQEIAKIVTPDDLPFPVSVISE